MHDNLSMIPHSNDHNLPHLCSWHLCSWHLLSSMNMHHYIFGRLCSESTFLCCCSIARLELVRKTHTNSMAATLHVYCTEYYFGHSDRLKCSDLLPRSCKNPGNMLDLIHIKSGLVWILEALAQSWLDDSCIPACFQTGSICPQNLKIPIRLWQCLNWNHDLLIQWKIASDCDGVWIDTIIFWSAVTNLQANSTIGTSPLLFNFTEFVSTSHVPLLRLKCREIYLK